MRYSPWKKYESKRRPLFVSVYTDATLVLPVCNCTWASCNSCNWLFSGGCYFTLPTGGSADSAKWRWVHVLSTGKILSYSSQRHYICDAIICSSTKNILNSSAHWLLMYVVPFIMDTFWITANNTCSRFRCTMGSIIWRRYVQPRKIFGALWCMMFCNNVS